jgi:hypothetical protein
MFPSRIDLDWRETCREILVIERLTSKKENLIIFFILDLK